MSFTAEARWDRSIQVWNALVAVHRWLAFEFMGEISGRLKSARPKGQTPFTEAHELIEQLQFDTFEDFYRECSALRWELDDGLQRLRGLLDEHSQAGEPAERERRRVVAEDAFNESFQIFQRRLFALRRTLRKHATRPYEINLPDLQVITGALTIYSDAPDDDRPRPLLDDPDVKALWERIGLRLVEVLDGKAGEVAPALQKDLEQDFGRLSDELERTAVRPSVIGLALASLRDGMGQVVGPEDGAIADLERLALLLPAERR